MLNLVTVATFALVMSLVWLAARALWRPRPAGGALPAAALVTPVPDAGDQRRSPLVESLAAQLPFASEELDKDLRRAGYYRPHARQRFLAVRNGLAILAVIATGGIAVAIGPDYEDVVVRTVAVGLAVAVLCWTLPRVVLAVEARHRVQRISAALPDALDAISMCLYGGITLSDGVAYVGRELATVHPDLALELMIVNQQAEINSFEFAVQQFAARIDAGEIVALAAMVTQNQRLGTGVMEAVREFADNLRAQRRQMAEAKAARAELFLLFPVVLFLVPSVLLVLWGPALLQIYDFLRGMAGPIQTGL